MSFWNAIVNHLTGNYEAYIVAIIAFLMAVGKSMPQNRPKTLDDLWAWLRSSVQTVLPAPSNTTPPPQIAPQPPVNPSQPVPSPVQTK